MEDKIGETLEDIGVSIVFLSRPLTAQEIIWRISKCDHIKFKCLYTVKEIIVWRDNLYNVKKFTNYSSDRGLISRTYKEPILQTKDQIKTKPLRWMDISQRKQHNWLISMWKKNVQQEPDPSLPLWVSIVCGLRKETNMTHREEIPPPGNISLSLLFLLGWGLFSFILLC